MQVAEFELEYVVFDPRSRMAHHLVREHAVVFEACDGHSSPAPLVADLVEAGHGTEQEIVVLLAESLAELTGLGLLEGGEPPAPPPCVGCGSRQAQSNGHRRPRRRR